MTSTLERSAEAQVRVPVRALEAFCEGALRAAGADEPTLEAATRSMMHGARLGIDSHGVRLLGQTLRGLLDGRVNPRPQLRFANGLAACTTLEADRGHGALAAYRAMDRAVTLADAAGIGAVAIRNAAPFGPAGAYALHAAEQGFLGLAVCNSDAPVRLHGGGGRAQATNAIAFAAPARDRPARLLDTAGSAISCERALPGGEVGETGGGLAGLVEVLGAVLTGMTPGSALAPMTEAGRATPRALGAFVLAISPDAFVERALYEAAIERYMSSLQAAPPTGGAEAQLPGEREWREAARRDRHGIPLDSQTLAEFREIEARFGLPSPVRAAIAADSLAG